MGIGTEPVQESSDVASDEVVDDSGVDAEEEREEEGSWRDSLRDSLRIMLLLWVGLPVTVLFWSVACGAILAAVEDWPFKDGFFFMGATMSTAVGLTARSPESEGGRFFVTIAFAWGLGIFAFCSAILATPIAAPIIRIFGLHTSGFEDVCIALFSTYTVRVTSLHA
ncbi:hypothetical protein DIPPA_34228 [Diplonema papillatum]|nr:hypothetical protein DIPPA_34228 [Diplonema papillatum]